MIILPCAEFESDLPEDVIEGEDDFIETGGRSVAFAMAEMLRGFGCSVEPPEYAGDHGWELYLNWRKRRFWFQITLIEGYILMTEDRAFLSRRLKKNRQIYGQLLTQLAVALDGDPRFHNIRWRVADDVLSDKPGAARPVSS